MKFIISLLAVAAISGCADLSATYTNPTTGQKYRCEAYGSGVNAIIAAHRQSACEARAKAAGFTQDAVGNNNWNASWRAQKSWTTENVEGIIGSDGKMIIKEEKEIDDE